MDQIIAPELTPAEICQYLQKAANSVRRRYPHILHQPGDELNRVVNVMMEDTYMQPHLHPGEEKIEKMFLMQGSFAVIFFTEQGEIDQIIYLEKGKTEYVKIPAFSWHTYVMLSEYVLSYETMKGKYNPETWKVLADWAPAEDTAESISYLNELKQRTR